MSIIGKTFMMNHAFEGIDSMEEQEIVMGPIEQHLGIPWQLSLKRDKVYLHVEVNCNLVEDNRPWSLSTEVKGQLLSTKGGVDTDNFTTFHSSTGDNITGDLFMHWKNLEDNYLVDGSIQVNVEVKITKATGIPKKKLIHFDSSESNNGTQGVLIVDGEKFYVDKKFLASHSSEFNALFFGEKASLEIKEFSLDDIRVSDFQNFLEDVHWGKGINDGNVDGILKLAKQFEVEDSIERCEKFLVKKSEKSLKDMLMLAKNYDLEAVRDHCLSKLDTKEKILSVVPGVSSEMDPAVASFLLKKFSTL